MLYVYSWHLKKNFQSAAYGEMVRINVANVIHIHTQLSQRCDVLFAIVSVLSNRMDPINSSFFCCKTVTIKHVSDLIVLAVKGRNNFHLLFIFFVVKTTRYAKLDYW